ncbi:MAG: hypothetical protein WDM79_13700 [Terricaulis sp.]
MRKDRTSQTNCCIAPERHVGQHDRHVSTIGISSVELPEPGNSTFGSSETLVKFWTNVILRAAVEICLDNLRLPNTQRAAFEKELGLAPTQGRSALDRIRSLKLNASVIGVEVGLHRDSGQAAPSIDARNAALTAFLEEKFYTKQMFILFDGLDHGYIQSCAEGKQPLYLRVIGALIRASIEIKNHFKDLGRTILPTVFVRTDIFDQLQVDDRTKWENNQGVRLTWDEDELAAFARHRIHSAAKLNNSRITEKEALTDTFMFAKQKVTDIFGDSRQMPLVDYIVDCSLIRPRDAVTFLQLAATIASKESDNRGKIVKINKAVLEDAKRSFGTFLKKELSEELTGEFPIMNILLNRLSGARQSRLDFSTFCAIVDKAAPGRTEGDKLQLASRLFDLGFFGQITGNGRAIYALRDDEAFFDEMLPLIVHPCYARALNLAEQV